LSYKKYHEAIETREVVHFEDYFAPLNKWYEVSAFPSANGLAVYFKDITERKNSEIQLKELNLELAKRAKDLMLTNAELEQFAYVASHDLQEPLRMVSSFLQLLKKKYSDKLDDQALEYIHFAVDGSERMKQLILDLLEYSRAGSNEDALELLDLNKSLNEVFNLLAQSIAENNVKIEVESLPKVMGVPSQIIQLFQNIISNAIKYKNTNFPPEITISTEEEATHWRFEIKDNGIGIDPQYHEKIFIIFQRLHNRKEYQGTGIGLSICKKIVERHGGRIWVRSNINEGCTFFFTLKKE